MKMLMQVLLACCLVAAGTAAAIDPPPPRRSIRSAGTAAANDNAAETPAETTEETTAETPAETTGETTEETTGETTAETTGDEETPAKTPKVWTLESLAAEFQAAKRTLKNAKARERSEEGFFMQAAKRTCNPSTMVISANATLTSLSGCMDLCSNTVTTFYSLQMREELSTTHFTFGRRDGPHYRWCSCFVASARRPGCNPQVDARYNIYQLYKPEPEPEPVPEEEAATENADANAPEQEEAADSTDAQEEG